MVLPIIVGVGITCAALTAKALVGTIHRFNRLSPQMIATLNHIRLERRDSPLANSTVHGSHIRYLRSRFNNTGFESRMTEREALLVLGIEPDEINSLDKNMLRTHYRRLMVLNHPDKNGSVYLSQKINQAKDVLENSYLLKK